MMMTLSEAIQHCEEKIDSTTCGQEHAQLAEWLRELQRYKELEVSNKEKIRKANSYNDINASDLKWMRKVGNLSLTDAARILGVEPSTFDTWENELVQIPLDKYIQLQVYVTSR